ncbi:mucin-binding lectin 1 [Coprinopsis sp. MPI-PUGE-AT-0042]|nr:mucin-binding lectin 1 [Coprinopsis sp. MPI-PUGE-AT-0042]
MSNVFASDKQLTVVTRGPGAISLLTWENTYRDTSSVVGAVQTNKAGLTRWVVSFSHNYLHFAIKWDGQGEAVYQVGEGLERKPVGRDWNTATTVNWGNRVVVTENVSARVAGATVRNELTTVWIIPDTL